MNNNPINNWKSFASKAPKNSSKRAPAPKQGLKHATQHTPEQTEEQSGRQLIRVEKKPEILLSDHMGCQIINLRVGNPADGPTAIFSIHKDLLAASSKRFARLIEENDNRPVQITNIEDTSANVFKLFNEYLYKDAVPGVPGSFAPDEQGNRIFVLCQLYVFGEIWEVSHTFLNKVMDKIQDGLHMTNIVLPVPTIEGIFDNTEPNSLLRRLVVANVLYSVIAPGMDSGVFVYLVSTSDHFIYEFKKYMESKSQHFPDPRVRDLRKFNTAFTPAGESEDGLDNNADNTTSSKGIHPCAFHIHPQFEPSEASELEVCNALNACHLFSADAELTS